MYICMWRAWSVSSNPTFWKAEGCAPRITPPLWYQFIINSSPMLSIRKSTRHIRVSKRTYVSFLHRFVGQVLRSQLITMLDNGCWGERSGSSTAQKELTYLDFTRRYPQRTPIEMVELPDDLEAQFVVCVVFGRCNGVVLIRMTLSASLLSSVPLFLTTHE